MKKNTTSLENYSKKEILAICGKSEWDLGNGILYDMCKKYPKHINEEEIIAKIWLIGRSYAASIERRKNKDELNDDFYIETVAPALKDWGIDRRIAFLNQKKRMSDEAVFSALELHGYMQGIFKKITGLEKRSLASKYLHFHLPHIFYMYDSRAGLAVGKLIGKKNALLDKNSTGEGVIDKQYAAYFMRALQLHRLMEQKYQMQFTPRQVDKFLMHIAREIRLA